VTKVALRGIAARKLRAFTTFLAIFLGVALVAGTFVLTDTINRSFDEIFSDSLKGTDVVITGQTEVEQDDGMPPAFPAALLERTRQVDGVEAASGSIFSLGKFVKKDGDALTAGFAPNFISSHAPERFESLNMEEGHPPRTANEATLDKQTAERGDLEVGDTLYLAAERRVKGYRLVGTTTLGDDNSFGGAGIAQLTLPEAQRVTDKVGEFDQISVAAADGVSDGELASRIREVMPRQVQVETAEQNAKRQSDDIASDLSFFTIFLLVFAFVALFVGAFLIFNTFSITVAQRTREFGMLRTLGASRRQVLNSIVSEALLLGLLGGVLGLVGGLGFAKGINALFKALGIDLPNTGTVIEGRTIVVSLLVGLGVTLISVLFPAIRATRVSPMAALREMDEDADKRRVLVTIVAGLLGAVGLAFLCIGLFGGLEDSGAAAGLGGGGMAIMLLAVALLSPRLVKPLANVAGKPIEKLRGLTGRLARENAMRKPGRTASTAAALMIGLALVVFVAVFTAGLKKSVDNAIDSSFQGELVLSNSDGFSPIPQEAVEKAGQVPGVSTSSSLTYSNGKLVSGAKASADGSNVRLSGVDPATVESVLTLDWQQGSAATLSGIGERGAVVDDAWAKANDVEVGGTLRVRTPKETTVDFTVRGTVKDNADLFGNMLVDVATLRAEFGREGPSQAFLALAPGVNADRVQDRVDSTIGRAYPTVEVENQQQLKDRQAAQIDQLLNLVYGLLFLAVLVALFGIVNTLALSIHERTRELGMLRAVGMSRRQVRQMIRYEAVITALIGALLGAVLGVIFALLVSRPLADEGFVISIPIGTLIGLLVLAAVFGVIAAIGPARRASRLDVLRALAYE
jgi:putative ABC transport system permease protein